jgi:hypothetical protein
MPGKKPALTALESRKQMLVVESELNRALLTNEFRDLKNEVSHLKAQVHAMGSLISSAADLASTFASVGSIFGSHGGNGKGRSWISTIVQGVRVGASVWGAVRSRFK